MYRLDVYENRTGNKILMSQWFVTYSDAKRFAESVKYIRESPYTIKYELYETDVLA